MFMVKPHKDMKLPEELKPAYDRSMEPADVETRMSQQLAVETVLHPTGALKGIEVDKTPPQGLGWNRIRKFGVYTLVAAGIGAGAMTFTQLRGGSERPLTPSEQKQYVDDNGHESTNRN